MVGWPSFTEILKASSSEWMHRKEFSPFLEDLRWWAGKDTGIGQMPKKPGATLKKTRQFLWKRHRVALQSQLRGMRAGYERPTTTHAPLSSIHSDWREEHVFSDPIQVGVCPFCLRGFQPAWDCRLASCRHAYHSWCALTHFSESTKCIHKDGAMEMHKDWWICTGIQKPVLGKDGVVMAAAWERAPLTCNPLTSLILCPI